MIDKINIKYIDEDTNQDIVNTESFDKTIKEIEGYEFQGDKEVTINVENNIETTVVYKYKKITTKDI